MSSAEALLRTRTAAELCLAVVWRRLSERFAHHFDTLRLCDYENVVEAHASELAPPGYWEYFADVAKTLLAWRKRTGPKKFVDLEDMVRSSSHLLCVLRPSLPASDHHLHQSLPSLNTLQVSRGE